MLHHTRRHAAGRRYLLARLVVHCPPGDQRMLCSAQVKMLFNSFGGLDFYDIIPDVSTHAQLLHFLIGCS